MSLSNNEIISMSDEEAVLRLSWRPQHILDGVISISDVPSPTSSHINRKCNTSLGRLDDLPLELLCEAFDYLDVASFQRLSCDQF